MDLFIFVVILVGTLAVLLGLHFFLLKPLSSKSFEEELKEKREMREKILGTAGTSKSSSTGKDNANKKSKKMNKKPQQQKQKVAVKDSDLDSGEVESDSNTSGSQMEEEINPLTYAKKKVNASVEYVETEAFALTESQNKKKEKPSHGKKNKQKGGILVNKAEPVLVKQEPAQEINHFEQIHPKDALEIARQQKEEDSKTKSAPKEQRKNKNKDHVKQSPKSSRVEEIPIVPAVAPVVAVAVAPIEPKPATVNVQPSKEKPNKKKKNELITKQLAAEVQDAANVQSLVRILAKADLPRNDIQILIDFLLNKQQDTLTKDPSEWNDPSDPLQKLKKQLQEKENQLLEEHTASSGLHAKLKELRQELNNEKNHNGAMLKSFTEELNAKRMEVQNLNQQMQLVSEKFASEKQSLSHQYQQLHTKYVQLSEKHAAAKENASTVVQLNENMQLLQRELITKGQLLNEKLQTEEELLNKKTEYEILLHQKDELIQQRLQELKTYENEAKQLRAVAVQNEELVATCQQQNYELEQLNAQVGELQNKQKQAAAVMAATTAANTQAEESSKVEIRNLQNALDSSKTELTVYRSELAEYKLKHAEQEQHTKELRAREEDLQKQIEEQKAKNNELAVAASKAQQAANHIAEVVPVPKVDIDKVILEEQNRTKDLLVKLLPQEIVSALPLDATNFHSWLESTVTCIREQQESVRLLAASNASVVAATPSNNSTESVHHSFNNTSRSSNNSTNNNSSLNDQIDVHGGKTDEGSSKNGAPELAEDTPEDQQALTLRNEQLQKSVDQYKLIIADTEIMLKNLESKVIEQDIHWRSVVQAKDKELNLLKSAGALQ
ncbi:golgin subfamily B member 1 isoform X2 [Armigeres subalbatus]|uniref:golgin subfamily B member 1 isoform X2 n=1 Tax=Armigeres subalbatus TaxID=124917 RepID=UPI002ED08AB0